MNATPDAIVRQITINAPARRVFDALAEPDHRLKWWGADGKFQLIEMQSDLVPGGAYLMRTTT
ncbi:MAG: SRPBCC domain-containing protein, partial [Tepidisphaeraceae bacterium]